MAFLEVITRCYERPKMLKHNIDSLLCQTCDDWTQTLLIDEVGHGVGWSYQEMARQADELEGDYIWILDDDDMCIRNTLVDELSTIVTDRNPDVIMLRMNHLQRGILPSHTWGQYPRMGDIGCSAFVVRRDVWVKHSVEFERGDYSNDYYFISAIFDDSTVDIFWHDVIASQIQKISMGKPEAAL
jgi:hypothetical protein